MYRRSLLLLLPLLICASPAFAQDPAPDARDLARQVAEAAGLKAWDEVGTFSFSFVFAPKNVSRSYVWRVREGMVDVTDNGTTITVRVSGPLPTERVTKEYLEAHQRFVNDSFWALPALHLVWDAGTTVEDLGEVEVPGVPALLKRRAIKLSYDPNGAGYTPGDAYVYYLGDDHYPVAWAFHRQGAAEARFVAEWRNPRDVGGLKVVEQYWAMGGALNLQIQDAQVAPAEAGTDPTSRPTSRPAPEEPAPKEPAGD